MPTSWNVEDALEELVNAIQDGALLLMIEYNTRVTLKSKYRKDFQAQCDKGVDWNTEKIYILPQANGVGLLAAYLTAEKALISGSGFPKVVDPDSAYEAGHRFAHVKSCPDLEIEGVWCMNYPDTPTKPLPDKGGIRATLRKALNY